MLTQQQIAQQMIAQLRVLDPSVSAEVGTPERKIIDTVAQEIAEAGVDANVLGGSLDLASKYGSDLDNYVGLFGFGRQSGAQATGFVTFSRLTPSPYPITVPRSTQIAAQTSGGTVTFQTTDVATMMTGNTTVIAPIQALISGAQGNVSANTVTQFANLGAPLLGITGVMNENPTSGGSGLESDAELKVRFKNTVFRNMSGTADQYLALALSTQYTTKANVIGPISRYQEYFQVPLADDSTDETDPDFGPGNGAVGAWTTTPSNNPYAKYVYADIPYFMSNGGAGSGTLFYNSGIDFVMNAPPLDVGDTYREIAASDITSPGPNNPNFTLLNVYTGDDPTVQLPTPSQVVLCEYSYMSAESRNDITRNVLNCVDVYVNGENPLVGDAVVPLPVGGGPNMFNSSIISPLYYENFRRFGQPNVTPVPSQNIFQPLFFQPVIDLPDQIVAGTNTYLLGVHYYGVEDWTLLGDTVRARNGIEWDPTVNGMAFGDPIAGPYTGPPITGAGVTSYTVSGYTYDRNIIDLQTAMDAAKQVTTDVLAHRSRERYFKFDLTVVYGAGNLSSAINPGIQAAIQNYLDGQYFGSTILLTDILLNTIQSTGVANVRWSNDVINPAELYVDYGAPIYRVIETDVNGVPLGSTLGVNVFDTDFYLRDNELPTLPTGQVSGDSLPGLIARPRAENTFNLIV